MAGGTTQSLQAKRREYAHHYKAVRPLAKLRHAVVPADIERREEHAPCGFCGVARAICRHRPWMLANG